MVILSTQSPPAPLPSDNPASSSTAASRPARRRGLSYLRSYTQSHLSSSSNQNSISGAVSSSFPRHSIFRSSSYPTSEQVNETTPNNARKVGELGQEGFLRVTNPDLPPPSAGASTGPPAVNTTLVGFSRLMARNRAGSTPRSARREEEPTPSNLTGYAPDQMPTIRLVPHQDPRAQRPSLTFPPTSRTLPHEDCVIRVGRYSERDSNPNPPPNTPSSAPVGFKSKVVSRRHCEFWCSNGQWYIRDVKSSSGTFLNHIRLSHPSVESRPWPVNDGDVVQLGIDFRGGEEMIFRCVKIRVECNRGWQKGLNSFNVTTHKQLRNLGKAVKKDNDTASTHSSGTDCSICLMSIAPCQSLFVAPCSHVWHYKCIRPILNDNKTWPQFLCPNCRAMADLEADVDDLDPDEKDWEDYEGEDEQNQDHSGKSDRPISEITGVNEEPPPRAENRSSVSVSVSAQSKVISFRPKGVSVTSDNSSGSPSAISANPSQFVSSIINRRNTSWRQSTQQPQPVEEQSSSARSDEITRRTANLRSITPDQPNLGDADVTPPNNCPLARETTPTRADIASDGPMTPTNDAGPFVFDGSAGRAAGSRMVADMLHGQSA